MPSKIVQLDLSEEFLNGINLRNLRDTICHSFVSVERSDAAKLGRIIIDDRSQMNRKNHNEQKIKTKAVCLDIIQTRKKLKQLHAKVIDSIK